MKISFIISSFRPLIGGAERTAERVASRLSEQGHDVTVLTRRRPGLPSRDKVGTVKVIRLGLPSTSKLGAVSFLVHCIWVLSRQSSRGGVVHVHSPDTPLYAGIVSKVLMGRVVVVTLHGDPAVLLGQGALRGKLRVKAFQWSNIPIAALTESAKSEMVELGVPPENINVIPNGVDIARFSPAGIGPRTRAREEIGVQPEAVLYLFVGRLIASKRVDTLLRAWVDVHTGSKTRLVIVGDGPDLRDLRRQADKLGLQGVDFEGSQSEVVPYLEAADVFVLPSEIEGLSVALLEAMATGLPAVVSARSGTGGPVSDGQTGLKVDPTDPAALATALNRLKDSKIRRKMGRRASEVVREKYSLDVSVRRHLEFYRHALKGVHEPHRPESSHELSSRT